MIALILLLFVEIPVRIKIAIDYQRSEFEDRFTPLKSPPGTGGLHAILHQMTASPFDHPGGDGIALGQVVRIVEISRMIGQVRPVRPFLRRFRRNGPQPCIKFWRKAQQRQNTLLERAQSRHMAHDPLGPLDDRQGDVLKRFE
jgi:hypothetical protein